MKVSVTEFGLHQQCQRNHNKTRNIYRVKQKLTANVRKFATYLELVADLRINVKPYQCRVVQSSPGKVDKKLRQRG